MKRTIPIAAFALAISCTITGSFAADDQKLIAPNDVKWSPAPPVLPKGVEASVLHGDPTKEGLFIMRLKVPAGGALAPHTHPVNEVVTVISFQAGDGGDRRQDESEGHA